MSVTAACRYLKISRQAYYKRWHIQRKREIHEQEVISFVKEARLSQPRLGTRKLKYIMAQHQLYIGRDKLFSLLKLHRLLVPTQRSFHRTTHSHHRFHCHPNIIKSGFKPVSPEQLWVADITYLPTQSGEAYLSLVTDAYSRKIVGYHVHDNLRADSVIKAYKQALKTRKVKSELIHHSDRGIQYCSSLYQDVHKANKVRCSMTDGYDCYQNALAERVNGILKQEYLLRKPNSLKEAQKMVEQSVVLYNQKRPHMALKYKTPDEVHRAF